MHEALVGYYPTHAHEELANLLGKSPDRLESDFIEKVATVAFIVESGERWSGHPTKKQSRAALKVVSRRALALVQAVEALDWEARSALGEASAQEFGLYDGRITVKNPRSHSPPSEDSLQNVDLLLVLLKQIGSSAQNALGALAQAGRPTNKDIPGAIAELRKIWTDTTGKQPTLSFNKETTGRFLRFCQIVLNPVCETSSKFERAVRNELYGQNAPLDG